MAEEDYDAASVPVGGRVSAAQAIANAALEEAMTASDNNKDKKASRSNLGNDESPSDGRCDFLESQSEEEDDEDDDDDVGLHSSAGNDKASTKFSSSRNVEDNNNNNNRGNDEEEEVEMIESQANRTNGTSEAENAQAMKDRLRDAWRFTLDEHSGGLDPLEANELFQRAYDSTLEIVADQLDSIIQEGLQAYKRVDQLTRESELVKETSKSKDNDIERLRETNDNSQKTIQNLLRAVEKTKTDATEASKTAVKEVELRAEIQSVVAQKDKAQDMANESKRKYTLLEDELRQIKIKLSKVEKEKSQFERDRNATMSLAKSVDDGISSDLEYHKRKVTEQNMTIQGLNAVIAEKDNQLREQQRLRERSMSGNRLAQFRASNSISSQVGHHRPSKKARKRASY